MTASREHTIEVLAGDGNIEALKHLFESGYIQNEIDRALENAVAYSQIKTAQYLLSLGADLSANAYNGVYYAVHNDEIEGLKFAITKGVDININGGILLNTSIMTAINVKNIYLVKWLLDNGANPAFLTKDTLKIIDDWGSNELKAILKIT